jgi:hypothetical protein
MGFSRHRLNARQQAAFNALCERLDICGPDAALIEPGLVASVLESGHFDDCPLRKFGRLQVGDRVERRIAGVPAMTLEVTEVTEDRIVCGAWVFDRATGAEIDDELGWGPDYGVTGSQLVLD